MYLKHLSICGFRGVGLDLDLPLAHQTIIYGPNGSGKSSALQAIAWTIYGKLPLLTGGVFTREDALVNDFLDEARAAVTLTLSDDVTITRSRNKQQSTTRGRNPVTVSFETEDPQAFVEQMLGLTREEFFAAVFLHQETIRDFIISTPETRSATIDRMLGTYLLRTLVKVVDPRVPAKAIEEAEESIRRMDQQLSQASVISREMIRKRKKEHGDPTELSQLLNGIRGELVPIAEKLGLAAPEATLSDLEKSLNDARQGRLDSVSALESQIGQLGALKERYEQVAAIGWQAIYQRKEQYGDPANLPNLLAEIQRELTPATEKLGLPAPGVAITNLEESLKNARRAQLGVVGQLEKQAGQFETLKERYEYASQEVIEDVSIPSEVETRRAQTQAQIDVLDQEIQALTRQLSKRQAVERELAELRSQVQILPGLCDQVEQMQEELESLEAAGKRGTLYNQILATGQEYLERAQPDHCPLCKERISDLQRLLEILQQEMPKDIERMRQEHKTLNASLVQKRSQSSQLKQKKKQIQGLETTLAEYSQDIELQIRDKQEENKGLASELTAVHAEIVKIEGRIKLATENRKRLETVVKEIEKALEQSLVADVTSATDRAIRALRERATEIQAFDFQPTADKLHRTEQLGQIEEDEDNLRQRLDAVLEEVREALERPPGDDVVGAIDQAIQTIRERATEMQALHLQPIAKELDRAKQLDEIQKDESRLREFESSYQTTTQEKARLNHQVQRLTDLRNALQDIAETTKRRQQAIVAGVLNALDIHHYYQHLDPHPAYRQLQIEPEQTKKGTYHYWIKALTNDRSHGTYVQTRFSTAQANCAAISIFLAVNQHLSKKLETVILDDPSQSMDPEHKRRLAQTLASIPRQVIVATEDPQMFEFLVDAFETPTIHQLDSWTIGGASLV